jgi:hypothetical protein
MNAVLKSSSVLGAGVLASAAVALGAAPAHAALGFKEYYAPNQWTLTSDGPAGGSTFNESTLSLTSSNNNSGSSSYIDYTIIAQYTGTYSFGWNYATADDQPEFDPFFYINGVNSSASQPVLHTVLAPFDSTNTSQSGFETFFANAGDVIGFRQSSIDSRFGSATTIITGFNSADVPGPLPIFGAAAAFGWSRKLRKRIKQSRSGTCLTKSSGSLPQAGQHR